MSDGIGDRGGFAGYLVAAAWERLTASEIDLDDDARVVLQEMILGGLDETPNVAESSQEQLERSLEHVLDHFIEEARGRDLTHLDAVSFEAIWLAICFYPWCTRHSS
jgi:hypothetical protein